MRMDNEMMRQAEVDLLVDGELAEEKREALLSSLDGEPGRWRTVAIRFLERQVEKETVRGLMGVGGCRTMIGRGDGVVERKRFMTWWRMGAVAASIVAAAGCMGIGMYVERMNAPAGGGDREIAVNIPGKAMGGVETMNNVSVPVVDWKGSKEGLFEARDPVGGMNRRSVIIQPDGKDNVVVIPVNSLPVKVY